jgi:hypothetical protein
MSSCPRRFGLAALLGGAAKLVRQGGYEAGVATLNDPDLADQ